MILYHYTISDRLIKILIDGYLKLTPSEDSEYLQEGERRAVWLTSNPEWDRTAFYGYPDNVLEHQGKIRISIKSDALMDRAVNKIHWLGDWDSLVWSAMEVKVDHRDWFVTFQEVGKANFKCVELWKDNQWQKIPLNL